jgi:hypothetical protein
MTAIDKNGAARAFDEIMPMPAFDRLAATEAAHGIPGDPGHGRPSSCRDKPVGTDVLRLAASDRRWQENVVIDGL